MRAADLPLRGHVLFESRDRDETRQRVAQVFCPHELRVCRTDQRIDARQHLVVLGRASISYLSYGACVDVDPVDRRPFYLVQVPVSGSALIRIGTQEIVSCAGIASVINPMDAPRMQFSADCGQLIVRFDSAFVESLAAHHLGHALQGELRFENSLHCCAARARRWLDFVRCVVEQIGCESAVAPGPLAIRQLEQALLALLLEAQPSNFSERLTRVRGGCTPRHVRKAVEFIEAHAAEPIGIEEIVAASGASMRSLYEGFRRSRGTSPMEFLRSLRLRRVREDLLRAQPGTTVSEVAVRWGFYQFGRFAGLYRQLCGEAPSATLRRALDSRD